MTPVAIPFTMPEEEPTSAIEELALVQMPPVTEFDNVAEVPVQSEDAPPIVAGIPATVTTAVLMHPPPIV